MHGTHTPAAQMGVAPAHSALVVHWSALQEPSALQNSGAGHEPWTAGVCRGLHPTHAPLVHVGVVPPHWALVEHCICLHVPSTLQNSPAGQVPWTALSWPGEHAAHAPDPLQTGVAPPHCASDVHCTA